MNGQACCILGVCCPPASAKRREALAGELVKDGVCGDVDALAVAKWVLKHFDLAPAGTLVPYVSEIARMAREAKTAE